MWPKFIYNTINIATDADGNKSTFACVGIIIGWLAPVNSLILITLSFILIDFITGIMASYKRAKRLKHHWVLDPEKMWNTVWKLIFCIIGIIMFWVMDQYVLTFLNLNLHNIFAGFILGIELYSFLKHAAEISNHKIFRWIGNYMKNKIDETIKPETSNNNNNNGKSELG